MTPIEGFFCKCCKKLISPRSNYEHHCKSKEHYDKFVDLVNGKKTKALQLNLKKRRKTQESAEEQSEEEDDSGNWKRQRKNEYPVAYEF